MRQDRRPDPQANTRQNIVPDQGEIGRDLILTLQERFDGSPLFAQLSLGDFHAGTAEFVHL